MERGIIPETWLVVAWREPGAVLGCSWAWIWRKVTRVRGRLCGLAVDGYLQRSRPQSCPESPLRLASLGNSRRTGCESRSMSGQTLPGRRRLLWLSNPFSEGSQELPGLFSSKSVTALCLLVVSFLLCKLCANWELLKKGAGATHLSEENTWKDIQTIMKWFMFRP